MSSDDYDPIGGHRAGGNQFDLGELAPEGHNRIARENDVMRASSPAEGPMSQDDWQNTGQRGISHSRYATPAEPAVTIPFNEKEISEEARRARLAQEQQISALTMLCEGLNKIIDDMPMPEKEISARLCRHLLPIWRREAGITKDYPETPSLTSRPAESGRHRMPPMPNTDRPTFAEITKKQPNGTYTRIEESPTKQQKRENSRAKEKQQVGHRVLICLEPNSFAFDMDPYAIRSHIANKVGLDHGSVSKSSRTATGWAVFTDGAKTQQTIIGAKERWLAGIKAKDAYTRVEWVTYAIAGVPRVKYSIEGTEDVTQEELMTELKAQTGMTPVRASIAKSAKAEDYEVTIIASFLKTVPRPFRLFDKSAYAKRIDKAVPIPHIQMHQALYALQTMWLGRACQRGLHRQPSMCQLPRSTRVGLDVLPSQAIPREWQD